MNVESFKIAIAKLKAKRDVKVKLANYLSKPSRKVAETGELAREKTHTETEQNCKNVDVKRCTTGKAEWAQNKNH